MLCVLSARTSHCSEQQFAQHLFLHRSFKAGCFVSVRRLNKQSVSDPVALLACCLTRGCIPRLMHRMVDAGLQRLIDVPTGKASASRFDCGAQVRDSS